MKRIAVEGDFSGQMASGNIVNNGFCPGRDACPFERREEDRQHRFEMTTGIACSSGAREALQHLLDCGAFDYKQLAVTWRTRSIYWDIDALELKTTVSRIEFYYGWFLIALGLLSLALGLLSLVLGDRKVLLEGDVPQGAILILFISIAPIAAKYLVKPNRIAKRAEPYLQEYYASPR